VKRRVFVTGIGVISPIGNDVISFSDALFLGHCGFAPVTRFDASGLLTHFAAEVKDHSAHFRDVKIEFGLTASKEAVSYANQNNDIPLIDFYQGKKTSIHCGIGLELFSPSDLIKMQQSDFSLPENKEEQMYYLTTPADLVVRFLSQKMGVTLPPLMHISACAASTDAIGTAYLAIQEGKADMVLAGGTDSMINPMGFAGFTRLGALSERNQSPESASRPFDISRDGFVLGEGAGFIVLEEKEQASARGAKLLAEIKGYGNSLDAYNVSDPHPEGAGAIKAMEMAISDAGLDYSDISAINAHGTGTPKNDPVECLAIKKVFREKYMSIPVIGTKSMIGHLISAAGAVETIASILCLEKQMLHATANLTTPDPACQLDHVIGSPRKTELNHILKNSFGFGGQNASLVVSKC
jgi:3-oxoacyl-(acyl-carrier-protein) synthase